MTRPRQFGLLAVFGLGVLAGTIGSNLRTPVLQAQTRITLQSLQDQVNALQAELATKQNAITAGSGLVLAGNTLSISRPLDADTLGGVSASNFFPVSGGTLAGNLTVLGTISGNGGGLTNVPASALTGTISDARLSTNVALLDANNIFSGSVNVFSNKVGIGTTTPAHALTVNGGNIATNGFVFPASTSSPPPASASNAGGLIYNPALARLQYSDGTSIRSVATVP